MDAGPDGDSSSSLVLVNERDDGVALVTFDRADKRNAMNRQARRELLETLGRLRGRARVIVLTGSGSSFCAGVDLKEASLDPRLNASDGEFSWLDVQEAIRRHPAVFIAAVNGYALGGGVTLINACDLAIASEQAEIGMPEIGFGLYPGLAGPSTQLRILRKRAAWMVLTGQRIDGQTAESWGLVNAAVAADRLMDEAMGLASHIAGFDAVTLEWCKRALWTVPAQLSDWTTALEFGEGVGDRIKLRSDVVGTGLRTFASGGRNPGQGGASRG